MSAVCVGWLFRVKKPTTQSAPPPTFHQIVILCLISNWRRLNRRYLVRSIITIVIVSSASFFDLWALTGFNWNDLHTFAHRHDSDFKNSAVDFWRGFWCRHACLALQPDSIKRRRYRHRFGWFLEDYSKRNVHKFKKSLTKFVFWIIITPVYHATNHD